jgi:hypothetical protein
MNVTRVRYLRWIVVLVFVCALGLSLRGTLAQQPLEVTAPQSNVLLTLAGQAGGSVKALAIEGNFAYVGVGARLVVLDINNPAKPVLLKQTEPLSGTVRDVAIAWPYVYLATSYGIEIVDVDINHPPIIRDQQAASVDAIAIDPTYQLLYAVGGNQLTVWDVYDVNIISPVGGATYTYSSQNWADIVLNSTFNWAYLTGGGEVLMLNVSGGPTSITVVNNYVIPGATKSAQLASEGTYLYVAACEQGLQIFSLSTLSFIGSAPTPNRCAEGVAADTTTTYITTGQDGLQLFDLADRANPTARGQVDTPGIAWTVALNGQGYAFLADDDALRSVNIVNPTSPYPVGQYLTHGQADFLTGMDDIFYTMDKGSTGGLRTYSIPTPITPTFQSTLHNQWADTSNVALLDGYAYYANSYLYAVNLSEPAYPFVEGTLDLPFSAYGIAAFRNVTSGRQYAVMAAGANGLQVVDVSDPQHMKWAGAGAASDAQGVFILEKYAFVANGAQGLKIFDLTNPASPQAVGGFDTAGFAWNVTVVGGYAFVADDSNGLQIVNVNNPVVPVAGGNYNTPGQARQVRVLGKYAFVADDFGGITVLDISNLNLPTLDSTYSVPGNVTDLVIADGQIIAAAGDAGLFVYRVNYTPAYVLSGKVTTGTSQPVQGVAIISPGTGYITHTNQTGNYLFFHMPEGGHYVRPFKAGYNFNPGVRAPIISGSPAENQDFTATALTYNVTGHVTDSRGLPILGISVADGLGNATTTNASGDYTLPLTAGPHHFAAKIGQWPLWPTERFINIPPGADFQDFTIPAPVSLAAMRYGGSGQIVARSGSWLYVQSGPGIAALNITRPYTPTLTGKTTPLPGTLRALKIGGRYAYAALDTGGLGIIDLINPAQPVVQSILSFPQRVLGLLVDGAYLYMATDQNLQILDLTQPTKPQPIANLALSADGPMIMRSGRIYMATGCNGLSVVNVNTPTSPALMGTMPLPGCVQDVTANLPGTYVYTALGGGTQNGLQVIDFTAPFSPTLAYTDPLSITVGRLAWDGNFVYYDTDSLGLRIYDISNPASIALTGTLTSPSPAYGMVIGGNTLYQTTLYNGLRVINVTNRTAPQVVGAYTENLPEFGKDVTLQGGFAYLADYDGLRIYDVTSPQQPVQVGQIYLGSTLSAAVWGQYAYLGTQGNGLYIVNISNPYNPMQVVHESGLGNVSDMDIAAGYAYLAGEGSGPGLRIFQIAANGQLTPVGAYSLLTDTITVRSDGQLAYVIQPDGGLHIVNVGNPASPTQVAVVNPPQRLYGVDVADGRIYLAGETGLLVLDAANPTASPLGFYATDAALYDVRVVGNYAYLAAADGLLAVNVANPAHMIEANFILNADGQFHSLALGGNYLYFANEHAGLAVYQLGQPNPLKVTPISGVNTTSKQITIRGLNFQPGAQAYLGSNGLTSVTVISSTQMTAVVPAGLAPATYALHVVNPDGGRGFLPLAYTVYANTPPTIAKVTPSQGPNNQPAIVDIVGSNFAPGAVIKLIGPQNLTVNTVLHLSSAQLRVALPPGLATGTYDLVVNNPNNQASTLTAAYTVLTPAQLDDLYALPTDLFTFPHDLTRGVPVQLALNLRRLGGINTLANVRVDFYEGNPLAGGTLIGSSTVASLPPNSVFATSPITWTPATSGLRYLYAVIDPASQVTENSETNNTISRPALVYIPFADVTPPEISSLSISQGATFTSDPLVTLNTVTSDDASGVRSLFFAEYEYIKNQGGWVVTALSGWLPVEDAAHDYPWQLTPGPGVHYIQAWAADWAGNVSLVPVLQFINYLPANAVLTTSEVHTYRLALSAGDVLQADLISLLGDADVYIFAPDGSLMGKSETGGADSVTFTAPADGVYQIEVEGVTASTYQLTFTVNGTPPVVQLAPQEPHPRGRGTPNSMPGDTPEDEIGLPSPDAGYSVFLPLITR